MTPLSTAELLRKAATMEKNKNCNAYPKLEFHQNIQWAPAYQRNNKANGQKNLRCYPSHCQGLGHQRGFCGHSILVNFYYVPSTVTGTLYSFGHFCIADCELASPAAAIAKGVSRDRFFPGDILPLDEVKGKIRNAEEPLKEYVEGLELQDRRVDADGSVRVNFEFNRNLKGWHYGFLGSKLTRNVHHTFKAYVLEKVEATPEKECHFKVLAAVTSPDWTLFCRRRNRASIPTSAQVKQQQLKQQALLIQKQQELLEQEAKEQDNIPDTSTHIVPKSETKLSRAPSSSGSSEASTCSLPSKGIDFNLRMSAPPPLHPTQYQAQRRFKKRRDSTPEATSPINMGSNSATGKPPRRFTSCPTVHGEDDGDDYFQNTASYGDFNGYYNNTFHKYADHNSCEGETNQESSSGRGRGFTMPHLPTYESQNYFDGNRGEASEEQVKHFFRRQASQERLTQSGRPIIQRKRTSSETHVEEYPHEDPTAHRTSSSAWLSCFSNEYEGTLGRSSSIPMLPSGKHCSSQLVGAPDPREVTLLIVLGMIDLHFTAEEASKPLHLRDPSQIQTVASTVSDMIDTFRHHEKSSCVMPSSQDGYKPDSYHFAKFLISQALFAKDLISFGSTHTAEKRRAEPYATISFILATLREYLGSFVHKIPSYFHVGAIKSDCGDAERDLGRLYPCMSTLSLKDGFFDSVMQHNQAKLSPRPVSNGRTHPFKGGDKRDKTISTSSTMTSGKSIHEKVFPKARPNKDEDFHAEYQRSMPHMDLDLEHFTQDLEPLAALGAEDDELTLRPSKSWKGLGGSRLSAKFSQPFFTTKLSSTNLSMLSKKLSEHSFLSSSFLGKPKKGSAMSLGHISSLFHMSDTQHANDNDAKHGDNSMKELDDFLKKECGVQEVEEVEG